jgi:hypothetical protein
MAGCTLFLILLRREWKKRMQQDECKMQTEEMLTTADLKDQSADLATAGS